MADTDQVSFLPAAPGFEVLTFQADKTYRTSPVIAWAIMSTESEGFVRAFPVTCTDAWSLNDDRTVCLPNGEVVCDDRTWATIGEWLAEMKSNDGKPMALPGARTVLALDSFRDKFRGGQ